MTRRTRFLAELRAAGYVFKKQTDRTDLYRKAGQTLTLSVPRKAHLSDTFIRAFFKREGRSEADAEAFLQES